MRIVTHLKSAGIVPMKSQQNVKYRMKGHVERKHPEKMHDSKRKEVDHKKKNPKAKIETPAVQNFQLTPIASPTPIYLGIPDDLIIENTHQPNLFPEMPRQTGSPVSLLIVPIDEFYNPKKCTEIIVLDESPLKINPPATPASPKVEPYDPEKPGMDRREVIFKEEIPFYPPRKIDLNSRYGRTYDWSHLQLPSEECRDDPRLQLSCPHLAISKMKTHHGNLKRRNMGIQTDKDMASEIEEFELVELSTEAKETQTDVQTEDTGIQCDILKELFNCF
ncbi:unnamed protein product [Mytilus edulis]|uniref:Uncharacterized protein n=1 Tax=Mytilus edulis TaxID=6550 RepID=A0A8S3U627_MYTED|nr:unnamed protein product [Mytilus edulis]